MAMTLVSTVTVGSGGAASILWSNIPQTGKDLLLLISGRNTAGTGGSNQDLGVKFNGGTLNANVTSRLLYADGGSAASNTNNALSFGFIVPNSFTSSTFGNTSVSISNYATSSNKVYSADTVQENNSTTSYSALIANLWSSSSAITSIELIPGAGTLAQHSSASLYIIS